MPLRALARLVVAVASLAPAASAQEPSLRPGRHRLGPAWVTVKLQLRNAGVDSNVFQTLVDPVRDQLIVVALQGDGVVPVGRRLTLSGTGYVEQHHFQREGDESATDFYGAGRLELRLGALSLFGGGGGGRFTQRFSIDVDERLPRQEQQAYAGAGLRLGPRLSLLGRVGADAVRFAAGTFRLGGDVKQAMDRDTLTATGELRLALTPRTSLVAEADALEDRFVSQSADVPRVRRSYRFLAGLEFGGRAIVTGQLLAGMREFPGTLEQGSPPYTGPVLRADLTLPLGHVAHLRLQGLRDVLYASSLVEVGGLRYRNAFVYQRYWGEAFLPLSPGGLATVLSGGFETADYLLPHPYLRPGLLAERVDHRFSAGASLIQRIGDVARIGGHVSWARRVSSLPLFSYEGLRYGVTAEIVP